MSSPYTRLMTEEEELMFDAGQMDGRDRERKRIIALLELEKDDCAHWSAIKHEWPGDHDAACERCRPINKAIALIKGENK